MGQKDDDTTEIKNIGKLGCISVYRWDDYTGLTSRQEEKLQVARRERGWTEGKGEGMLTSSLLHHGNIDTATALGILSNSGLCRILPSLPSHLIDPHSLKSYTNTLGDNRVSRFE